VSKTLEYIDEIFAKSNTNSLTPADVENIEFLAKGIPAYEQLQLRMIFEGIDLIVNDKTNKVFNP